MRPQGACGAKEVSLSMDGLNYEPPLRAGKRRLQSSVCVRGAHGGDAGFQREAPAKLGYGVARGWESSQTGESPILPSYERGHARLNSSFSSASLASAVCTVRAKRSGAIFSL